MDTGHLSQLIQQHINDGGFSGAAVIAAHQGEIVIEPMRADTGSAR